ncbi:unnamed protein product [Moneuplotes crassus]|uniref:RRM domain-containing protein n=1 Tax=Euplotes crassus TaxID=5936 RepID=A0AAD1UN17_EUPCR|nr:unnamed protein product [Moneuplotes crassus]
MDTKEEEKKESASLQKSSKEFKPSGSKADADNSQPNEIAELNKQYTQYVNYYLNQGLNQADAEAWAAYYMDQYIYQEGNDQVQTDLEGQEPVKGSNQEEVPAEEAGENSDSDDFEIGELGPKTKKPQGETTKGQYKGEHDEKYDESEGEDGYYDELGFYYNPDGSYYDPDGVYFDAEGYDEFGGYYDDEANYIEPEGDDTNAKEFKGSKQSNEEDDGFEEDKEDKYNKEFIKYIINSKLPDDTEFLNKTKNSWAYLKVGNLEEGTTIEDLREYFSSKKIPVKEMTIIMSESTKNPVAFLEIYKISVAKKVLKECGKKLKDNTLIIEVDNLNEKLYNGIPTSYNSYEYEDDFDARYTQYDPEPKE